MISKELKAAVKLSNLKSYQIAQTAGLHPSTLSKIICGIEQVKENDDRVLRIGAVLGLPASHCFEPTKHQTHEDENGNEKGLTKDHGTV